MYKPFDEMPGFSRLWIYQSTRKFTPQEHAEAERSLMHLCNTWTAHNSSLQTSFKIEFDQFIILAVDERAAGASGCSIDGSVRLLKELQQRIGVDFFDRSQVAFLENGSVVLYPFSQLKTLFEERVLNGDSVTFNNTLTSKTEWEQQWRSPAKVSWLSRYLPKAAGVGQPG
jgi:hypothetical protein